MNNIAFRTAKIAEDLIFDIGLDTAQDTEFYLKKGFRVVAVDANPAVCADAERRFAREIADGRLIVVNRAISETREPLTFYVCATASMLSTADPDVKDMQTRDGHSYDAITVQGVTVADLIAEYGVPYFAKIDIEGYDLICLKGLMAAERKPHFLSTELNLHRITAHLAALRRLGYRRFALVGQGSVKTQRSPQPPREGRYAAHAFQTHSSGLFGKELPARWGNLGALALQCAVMTAQFKLAGFSKRLERFAPSLRAFRERLPVAGQWFDIHAEL